MTVVTKQARAPHLVRPLCYVEYCDTTLFNLTDVIPLCNDLLMQAGGENMAPQIGEIITTSSQGIVGTVLEVLANKTGSWRVRIAYDGGEKWTTVHN